LQQNLETFLRHKKAQQPVIDWNSKKQKWLLSVNQLYNTIESWLDPLIKENIVQIRYENITLDEYYLKPYVVRQMNILVGYEQLRLEPKGMIIINALGRVDMIGDDGTLKLLLNQNNDSLEFEWIIALSKDNINKFPLTKETFSDALEQVMRKNV
jgi:hypothetical protein